MDDHFTVEDIAAMGWRTCGARTRSGEPCKNLAMFPAGRCRMHGGKSLRGQASPRYKHGKYSKDLLVRLERAAAAEQARDAAAEQAPPAVASAIAFMADLLRK